jgi:hypothetical protein
MRKRQRYKVELKDDDDFLNSLEIVKAITIPFF